MKVKIILKHKDSEEGEVLEMVNSIFDKQNGIAFFEIERDKWDLISYHPYVFTKKGVDYFEGDNVQVKGIKSIGVYETKIVRCSQGWTLKDNKTYLNNDACFTEIIQKV